MLGWTTPTTFELMSGDWRSCAVKRGGGSGRCEDDVQGVLLPCCTGGLGGGEASCMYHAPSPPAGSAQTVSTRDVSLCCGGHRLSVPTQYGRTARPCLPAGSTPSPGHNTSKGLKVPWKPRAHVCGLRRNHLGAVVCGRQPQKCRQADGEREGASHDGRAEFQWLEKDAKRGRCGGLGGRRRGPWVTSKTPSAASRPLGSADAACSVCMHHAHDAGASINSAADLGQSAPTAAVAPTAAAH